MSQARLDAGWPHSWTPMQDSRLLLWIEGGSARTCSVWSTRGYCVGTCVGTCAVHGAHQEHLHLNAGTTASSFVDDTRVKTEISSPDG